MSKLNGDAVKKVPAPRPSVRVTPKRVRNINPQKAVAFASAFLDREEARAERIAAVAREREAQDDLRVATLEIQGITLEPPAAAWEGSPDDRLS